ncbi:hypothetical protein A9975_01650 [Cupriavidus sp. UME77]|nr:hypothetical protein [Cupriavidus sp. UME77]
MALKAQSPDNEPWRAMLGARGIVRSWGECEAGSEGVMRALLEAADEYGGAQAVGWQHEQGHG